MCLTEPLTWESGQQEMVDAEPAAKPLRRRAVLLIGQCVPNLLRPDRPMAYNALLANLAAEDPAFKMAAVTSLHALVEDWYASFLMRWDLCWQDEGNLTPAAN